MLENARASTSLEPGCRQFDVLTDPARAGQVFLYELYDDEAAFKAHMQMPHFAKFNAEAGDMIADKDIKTFEQVAR
jgi:quinol monooxygenase YgiN